MTAQAILASLLASATVTARLERLAKSAWIQSASAVVLFARDLSSDVAPSTNSRRRVRSPVFEMRPSLVLPPVPSSLGVSPIQAAKWRPFLNNFGSGTSAHSAVALMSQRRERFQGACFAHCPYAKPEAASRCHRAFG